MRTSEERAELASRIIDNDEFQSAFSDTREAIISQIENGDIMDDKLRDKLMLSLQLLGRVKHVLEDRIMTGKLKEKALQQKSVVNWNGL
jgi:hypothetical protein